MDGIFKVEETLQDEGERETQTPPEWGSHKEIRAGENSPIVKIS